MCKYFNYINYIDFVTLACNKRPLKIMQIHRNLSECFTIQILLIYVYRASVGVNNKIYDSIVCIKLILIHMCAFVANVITYISVHFLNTGDI